MRAVDVTLKLLGLAEVIRKWQGMIRRLDRNRREKVAAYASAVAACLGRAAVAFEAIERNGADSSARREVVRELGQLTGYVETLVSTLDGHIDGRRLAGVKRRLEALPLAGDAETPASLPVSRSQIERLIAAEGYFLALADSLRV